MQATDGRNVAKAFGYWRLRDFVNASCRVDEECPLRGYGPFVSIYPRDSHSEQRIFLHRADCQAYFETNKKWAGFSPQKLEALKRLHPGNRSDVQIASHSRRRRLLSADKIRVERGSTEPSLQAVFFRIASNADKLSDQCEFPRWNKRFNFERACLCKVKSAESDMGVVFVRSSCQNLCTPFLRCVCY